MSFSSGASTDLDAQIIARTIASSSLVKTAVHGSDPNWGRIIAALGRSGASVNLNDVQLWIGPYQVFSNGVPIDFDRENGVRYVRFCFSGLTEEINEAMNRLSNWLN